MNCYFNENPMKTPWKPHESTFNGHENRDLDFMVLYSSHEFPMKYGMSDFHGPWKKFRALKMDFMGHEISTYYILAGFMTHENVTLLSMYFMGHEKPMKTL